MTRTKTRTRLFTGIYEDRSGIAIVVSVNGEPREFRKDSTGKPFSSYERHTLPAVREKISAREHLKWERFRATDDTFEKDVQRYLLTISSHGHRVNSQGYLSHWNKIFKDKNRNEITDIDVQTAFARIQQANSTKTHIRRALIQFYETLNGKSGYNPGRALKKPPKDEDKVRDIPWRDIERMFQALPPSRARARLKLMAYIGLPPKQIEALTPSDLRLERKELVVHPRRKGAGAAGRTMPLSPMGVAALKEFVEQDAFGTFQHRQLVETFWSGARKAKVTLPADARPYDLRHSFLTELARGGADIQDIAHLGMHATLEQAARYTKGAASARATKMISTVPRFTNVARRKPAQKPLHSLTRKRGTTRPTPRGRKRRKS